ncbi:MAG: serine/threonine-protein phosphatase 6 regulatory ankyrin repeat subunit A-like [Gammaproteobacteria bacterium]|jgi:hypothetical protein|nr:serine/threonine-protein phosphatase 6 regulatory ankyrin repeat subunit A-like [Gammaproteobacteria bacterium]
MKEQSTPFQQLLQKLYWWSDIDVTEENISQLEQWMQESEHTQEHVKQGDSFCLKSLIDSVATPEDVTLKLLNFLVAKGADIHYKNGYGNLLHNAIFANKQAIFEQLLEAEVDPNCKDGFGETPLHLAVKYNRPWAVKELLQIDTIQHLSLHEPSKKGKTPAELMTKETDFEIRTLLRQHTWSKEPSQSVTSTLRYRASSKPKEEQPLLDTQQPDQAKSNLLEYLPSSVRKILGY